MSGGPIDGQLDLLSRVSDPDTSTAAAGVAAGGGGLARRQLEVLTAIVVEHERTGRGCTAYEALRRLRQADPDWEQNVVSKRCTELSRHPDGLIVDRGDRREGRSPAPLIVWWPTDAGVRAGTGPP